MNCAILLPICMVQNIPLKMSILYDNSLFVHLIEKMAYDSARKKTKNPTHSSIFNDGFSLIFYFSLHYLLDIQVLHWLRMCHWHVDESKVKSTNSTSTLIPLVDHVLGIFEIVKTKPQKLVEIVYKKPVFRPKDTVENYANIEIAIDINGRFNQKKLINGQSNW